MEIENSTNNLVNTLKTVPDNFTSDVSSSTADATTTSYFFPKMIFIVILLAFIGGFVIIYLAKGDKTFTEFVTPYLNYIGIDVGKKETPYYDEIGETGATGDNIFANDATIDTTTPIDTSTVNDTSTTPNDTSTPIDTSTVNNTSATKDDSAVECENPKKENLIKALNNAAQTEDYMADDASSSIQSVNKSKWCFIGEEKGVRNCVLLNDAQKCMSGDIFPSKDICINPNMRT